MFHVALTDLQNFLATYGYWAVFFFVAIESIGIPFPGETMLLVAAIDAGTTHQLSIPLVIVAATCGAIVGDNIGFWIGREGGYRVLRRYGRYIGFDVRKLKVGIYLFRRHGGKVVFFGRFVAVLRAWAAFLAGVKSDALEPLFTFQCAWGICLGHSLWVGWLLTWRANPSLDRDSRNYYDCACSTFPHSICDLCMA